MVKLKGRKSKILNLVVKEYIKEASPVSSGTLKEKYNVDVSSATIRLDFSELTKAGFLKKTYVSGGRIPTDLGYRFFVDSAIKNRIRDDFLKELEEEIKASKDIFDLYHDFTKKIAAFSSNLSVSHFGKANIFWKAGWRKVFEAPEFEDVEYGKKFAKAVEDLEEKIEKLEEGKGKDVKVYIGHESPCEVSDFSFVVGKVKKRGATSSFVILGPKRMNFERNISLINCAIKKIRKINL